MKVRVNRFGMGPLKRAAIAVALAISLGVLLTKPKNGTHSQGSVSDVIKGVRTIFDEMLASEKEGVALAIYHDGELLADLWGGYADRDAARLWERDTMSVAFSTSKTVGALMVAILASRGYLRYNDPVIKYWPEFGKNGKENITVQWIVEHKAGLIRFENDLSIEQAHNHSYISTLIEQARPLWPAGTATGYHALTYGWLVDQIVRRADPQKRGVSQFFDDEIRPFMKDSDFYIGLPRSLHHRVARLVQPSIAEITKTFLTTQYYIYFFWHMFLHGSLMLISGDYPPWLSVVRVEMPYNNPAVREVENLASNGIGTARGLAAIADAIITHKLISEEVWREISTPGEQGGDIVTLFNGLRGHGFFHEAHPTRAKGFVLSHMGHGMQKVIFDPATKVSLAMLRNAMSWNPSLHQFTDRIARHVVTQLDAHTHSNQ